MVSEHWLAWSGDQTTKLLIDSHLVDNDQGGEGHLDYNESSDDGIKIQWTQSSLVDPSIHDNRNRESDRRNYSEDLAYSQPIHRRVPRYNKIQFVDEIMWESINFYFFFGGGGLFWLLEDPGWKNKVRFIRSDAIKYWADIQVIEYVKVSMKFVLGKEWRRF